MKIVIGSDHGGYSLKKGILTLLDILGHEVQDIGCYSLESVNYPDFADQVSNAVLSGEADRGILICGTGIGMSMAANKHRGIRAALCCDHYAAHMSRAHNDANILCLGERVTGLGVAEEIVRTWLDTPFEGDRHKARIDLFSAL